MEELSKCLFEARNDLIEIFTEFYLSIRELPQGFKIPIMHFATEELYRTGTKFMWDEVNEFMDYKCVADDYSERDEELCGSLIGQIEVYEFLKKEYINELNK